MEQELRRIREAIDRLTDALVRFGSEIRSNTPLKPDVEESKPSDLSNRPPNCS